MAEKKTSWRLIAIAATVALLMIGLTVILHRSNDQAAASPSSGSSTTPTSTGTQSAQAKTDTPLQRCQHSVAHMKTPLHRAALAMDQWEVHVSAMNKLVVGAISLSQATAFWNQSRVGAAQHIASFTHARDQLAAKGVGCPAGAPAACARKVNADLKVLRLAGMAIQTWDKHVGSMKMLMMGTVTPAAAEASWLKMWQHGVDEISAYKAAVRAADQAPACA